MDDSVHGGVGRGVGRAGQYLRDKSGKISKPEWMKFMEAEFDRLDKSKNGELDVKELTQSRLRVSHFTSVGK
jgi:hypothetical protein